MDRSSVITLVSHTTARDQNGVIRKNQQTERTVFAQANSVSRAEFFAGGENGLRPEYRFSMLDAEYNGERTVVYNGVYYSVYRTYHARTDIIELYVQLKAGTREITPVTPDATNAAVTE